MMKELENSKGQLTKLKANEGQVDENQFRIIKKQNFNMTQPSQMDVQPHAANDILVHDMEATDMKKKEDE